MQIPQVTKSQKRILFLLASFRFLLITQLQTNFSHKDPHRIKEWLIDLEQKGFIAIIKDPKDKTKPYIICLNQKPRYILKEDSDIDRNFLDRLYREKKVSEEFISRQLFIMDLYLFFLKHKEKKSQIDFFTQQDLQSYTYFPDPMPDAYIDETTGNENHRYFLNYLDADTSIGEMHYKVSNYFKYADNGNWQENTNNAPFPTILLIFEKERRKKHIYYYAKALLEKTFNNDIEIFVTTKEKILNNRGETDIWQRVEVDG